MDLVQGHGARWRQSWPATPDLCPARPAVCSPPCRLNSQAGPCVLAAPGGGGRGAALASFTCTCGTRSPHLPCDPGTGPGKGEAMPSARAAAQKKRDVRLKGPGGRRSQTSAPRRRTLCPPRPLLPKLLSRARRDPARPCCTPIALNRLVQLSPLGLNMTPPQSLAETAPAPGVCADPEPRHPWPRHPGSSHSGWREATVQLPRKQDAPACPQSARHSPTCPGTPPRPAPHPHAPPALGP